ncbi:L,D-transpeptidase [Streptomyces sp. B1866]|uniref:L,D-transpeptidase n=1 Tax=Streptomyces sp. B1866 TaxID=3075431 RepID=UPI0028921FE8|nr:L,D-transpeptidase [Streptomyces sp. B1866]MDT3397471.1 L,D-transpeptidase [Streptomyces sp. B1866]
MTAGVMTKRAKRTVGVWGAAVVGALVLVGCSAQADEAPADANPRKPKPSATARPTPPPDPAALKGVHVNVAEGQTVGVGMPISLTFDHPVPAAERAAVERRLRVTADPGTTGSWSWVKDRNLYDGGRVDYRPREPWKPGTRVTVHVGSQTVRHFSVGRSLVATVDVRTHTMTVVKDGTTRRVPITAGRPGLDTWNGTMVVMDKQQKVLMDSRTVNISDSYRGWYRYAVHLTTSGTYLHENPNANIYAGRGNVTHGCVGLATDGTARRFYEEVIPGDIVKVVGSKETVAPGNGYGDWNVDWSRWQAGSAL